MTLDVLVDPGKNGAPQNGNMAVGSSATHIVVTTATQIVVRGHVGTRFEQLSLLQLGTH